MTFNPNRLFNLNSASRWKQVNLGLEAAKMFYDNRRSPLLDPMFCEAWVDHLARKKKVDYTFGGYMENRKTMWRGSYLPTNKNIHLGIDFNVPADTNVYCHVPFIVRETYRDKDENGGWGDRVLIETQKGLVIFAHLRFIFGHDLIVDTKYPAGYLLGCVGFPPQNGGWFPHLHVQAIKDISLMAGLDGYSHYYKWMEKDYPNPLEFLCP